MYAVETTPRAGPPNAKFCSCIERIRVGNAFEKTLRSPEPSISKPALLRAQSQTAEEVIHMSRSMRL